MKLALHRSLTFWAGILVMTFGVWSWRDSQRYFSPCRFGDIVVANAGAGVLACHVPGRPPATFTRRAEIGQLAAVQKLGAWPSPLLLSAPKELQEDPSYRALEDLRKWSKHPAVELYRIQVGRSGSPDLWMIFIPHWLLLLAATIPWFALLLWRALRRSRATAVLGRFAAGADMGTTATPEN